MEHHPLMKHVFCDGFGGPEVLKIKESPLPVTTKYYKIKSRHFLKDFERKRSSCKNQSYFIKSRRHSSGFFLSNNRKIKAKLLLEKRIIPTTSRSH